MQQFKWTHWPPRCGCTWDSNLHGGPLHSSPFCGRPAHCAARHLFLTKDRHERAGEDAHGGGATCARAAGWQGARQACIAKKPGHSVATADLPTSLPFCSCPASFCAFGAWLSTTVFMLAMHWAAPAVYHMHAQHCMTPYSTHSTQPGVALLYFLVASSLHSLPFLKGHLVMCLFTSVLLEQFCFRFCFSLPSFLFFQHLAGSLGNSGFLHFCLSFLILRISAFFQFFRNSRSCWLFSCLVSRFDGQPSTLLNIQPVTSFSFQPTLQHTSQPTTPYHLTTAPYHPEKVSLNTSHPTQRWIWVAHTRSGATGGGGRQPHPPHCVKGTFVQLCSPNIPLSVVCTTAYWSK